MSHYQYLADQLASKGIDVEAVKARLKAQRIELPSWGFANTGTRFKTYAWPGAARNIYEKLADAGFVHRLTGVCPTVAIHIPWDKVDDWEALAAYAQAQGISIGAVNTNTFQADRYKWGSLTHADPAIRRIALEHHLECIEIAKRVGGYALSLWYGDGTNYAGQESFVERRHRMIAFFREVYAALPGNMRMLIEYKLYEPAFYHTDLADWGQAYAICAKLGPRAQVLVDLGHHAHGVNIEHIVATLLDEGKLGGFHFNNRKYGDDDLIVGTINPLELFLIFNELVAAGEAAKDVAYMIDQSHVIEPKIEAMVHSVINIQIAYAKALIVDRATLRERQAAHDVLGAHRVLMDAFETDVRPLLAQVRTEMGLPPDPIAALRQSGYESKIAAERGTSAAAGGYPEGD
ncbi:MAG: L-rhamnose isomerase [Candidatus Thermofonsia Clade 3 bacterium]|jgi:L-rhamnose isomerase/sugar isomerase|uniref:L-rhamnose isomerase n=1 Tax=Candidatus Thermofonsia Clade 3 bacterium TaxID=2364212 RepID=A0A2M8QA20_9CHLR|nr:L-rhamnose isomerase [Candidatus Roseilinea sp. NK_OTU-006]PJF46665.1 MAG: L-rhamnose isomerase [Candidatus Thermofonsia Clade 3 bacterium]